MCTELQMIPDGNDNNLQNLIGMWLAVKAKYLASESKHVVLYVNEKAILEIY